MTEQDDTIAVIRVVEHDDGATMTAVIGLATGHHVRQFIIRHLGSAGLDALMRDVDAAAADGVDAVLRAWTVMQGEGWRWAGTIR